MSLAKTQLVANREIWRIGGRNARPNPYLGWRVRVRWLRPWGGKPKGFTVEGTLKATFCVNGRTLIGEVITDWGKKVSCPWSKNWITVELLEPPKN